MAVIPADIPADIPAEIPGDIPGERVPGHFAGTGLAPPAPTRGLDTGAADVYF